MATQGGSPDGKKDDTLTVALIMIGAVFVMIFLIWMGSSVKIVKFWTPKMLTFAHIWLWVPGAFAVEHFAEISGIAEAFLANPKKVSLFDWIAFFNKSAMVPNLLVCLLLFVAMIRLLFKESIEVKRSFKPQQLAVHLSHVFTGIAPILHLRKKIAEGKEPYWNRQLFPHEALLNEKVNGKPLVMDGEAVESRVKEYFEGIVMKRPAPGQVSQRLDGLVPALLNGRLVSKMLGRQVVDLTSDRGKKPIYPDRFSDTGKIIYALLCAHAFGGDEGKADFAKARDQLNNAARGAAHGFTNLTVAQWLYTKYRNNSTAKKLFAIHHWEYTYLYEMLLQAKRQGKCGHWEYMWLKPMNRILFYTQNTVGRLTPHTESAATFAQYIYERRVAASEVGRIPLRKLASGAHQHVIYIDKAVKGLMLEWERWKDGEDDDNQWWTDPSIWSRIDGIKMEAPLMPPPTSLANETAFDLAMTAQAAAENISRLKEQASRAAAYVAAAS